MQIELASSMGFCSGVKRAIKLAEEAVQERNSVNSLGAIVHNQQVVSLLVNQGMRIKESLKEVTSDTILIPSHGVGPQIMNQIDESGLSVVDTTCSIVHKAQMVAQSLGDAGFHVLVFGDASHVEVKGLLLWAGTNAEAVLDIPKFDKVPKKIGILSQTTQSKTRFASFLSEFIKADFQAISEVRIFNTICEATEKRQLAALALAARVDLMLVIGGKHSANTRQLVELCRSVGVETLHVETAEELNLPDQYKQKRIGITSGASTPQWVDEDVVQKLKQMSEAP